MTADSVSWCLAFNLTPEAGYCLGAGVTCVAHSADCTVAGLILDHAPIKLARVCVRRRFPEAGSH
jgi:hypothetical protein